MLLHLWLSTLSGIDSQAVAPEVLLRRSGVEVVVRRRDISVSVGGKRVWSGEIELFPKAFLDEPTRRVVLLGVDGGLKAIDLTGKELAFEELWSPYDPLFAWHTPSFVLFSEGDTIVPLETFDKGLARSMRRAKGHSKRCFDVKRLKTVWDKPIFDAGEFVGFDGPSGWFVGVGNWEQARRGVVPRIVLRRIALRTGGVAESHRLTMKPGVARLVLKRFVAPDSGYKFGTVTRTGDRVRIRLSSPAQFHWADWTADFVVRSKSSK